MSFLLFISAAYSDDDIPGALSGKYDCKLEIDDYTSTGTIVITQASKDELIVVPDIPLKIKSSYTFRYDDKQKWLTRTSRIDFIPLDYLMEILINDLAPTSLKGDQSEFRMLEIGMVGLSNEFIKKDKSANANELILVSNPTIKSSNATTKESKEIKYVKTGDSWQLRSVVSSIETLGKGLGIQPFKTFQLTLQRSKDK